MSDSCTVQSLRLAVSARDEVPQVKATVHGLLAEATSGLEGLPGQLFVRRMEIGGRGRPLHSRRALNRACDELKRFFEQSLPLHSEAAHDAESVWVRSRADACAELALAASASPPWGLSAWYWPVIFPSLGPVLRREPALRLFLEETQHHAFGSALAAQVVNVLVERDQAEPLLQVLSGRDVESWLRQSAMSTGELLMVLAAHAPRHPEKAAVPGVKWKRVIDRYVPHWGGSDARSLWLTCTAAQGGGRVLEAPSSRVASAAASWLRTAIEQTVSVRPDRDREGVARPAHLNAERRAASSNEPATLAALATHDTEPEPRDVHAQEPTPHQPFGTTREDENPQRAHGQVRSPRAPEEVVTTTERSAPARDREAWAPRAAPQYTAAGGLLFLISVLNRLGLAASLDAYPWLLAREFGARLLSTIAADLRLTATDPLVVMLSETATGVDTRDCADGASVVFAAPDRWWPSLFRLRDFRVQPASFDPRVSVAFCESTPIAQWREACPLEGALQMAEGCARFEHALAVPTACWTSAVARWLAGFSDLSLASLVLRPASLIASRTHIDLIFHLEDADVAVRRAALDLNPGYVQWLGKVVTYHYLRS